MESAPEVFRRFRLRSEKSRNPVFPFGNAGILGYALVIIMNNCLADCISRTGFREFGTFELNGLEGFLENIARCEWL